MSLAPLAAAERIRGIDLARGIALLGILFVNVRFFFAPLGFAMRPDVALDGSARGTADALAWSLTEAFFTYKCISLFSMLFGFGLAMQAARARERGVSPWPSGLRRLGLLLAVGVVHWSLVWYGDILTSYAFLGLIVLACTGLSTNALRWCIVPVAGVVALVAVVGAGLYGLGAAVEAQAPAEAEIAASELTERGFDAMLAAQLNPYDPAWLEAERAAFREGPFTDALLFRSVNFAFGTVAAIFSYGWQSLLMMLCGVYAFKAGLFGPGGSEVRRRIAMPALAIGLALSVGSVLPAWLLGFESVAAQVVHVALLSLGAMVLPVAYAAIILEWGPRLPAWIATPVERAGRMSFTVYLLESVACTALASWWGLAWFGSLDDAQAAVVALCVWLALVIFATAWIAVLPIGPLEWAWRRVTHGNRHAASGVQPMKGAGRSRGTAMLTTLALTIGLVLSPPATGETSPPSTWVTSPVTAPRVSFQVFDSAAAKAKVSYHLYTPVAYGRDAEARFPVVYWLHGSGGGVAGIPQLAKFFDAAIEAGKVRPFLAVFVNGLVEGMYVDWKDGSTPIESMIVQDLVPHVDRTYRTVATREGRMLDGFSMGGYGAARLGFKFPERFRAVSMLGAGPLDPDFERTPRANPRARDGLLTRVYGDRTYFREVSPWEIAKRNAPAIAKDSLVRVAVGDRDGTFALNEEFHRHLESLSIPHEWIPLPGIEHDPMKTHEALGERHWDFYRRAFGVPAARAARQDGEVKLTVGGAERRAIAVNVPPEGQVRPAVLILHGGSGSAERMRANAGFDGLARAEGFMAVYAEGTDFGGDRHAWNTGHLLRRQVRDADDVAYFDALIDMLVRDLGADPARIFMTGGSNGGMMTFAYAVARPGRLAAAAPVVASMFAFDRVPQVPLPILIINGAKDEEVPLEGGMSRNRVVRLAQATPFKPVVEVVDFWVKANRSVAPGTTKTDGTVTTKTYAAGDGGAVTEFVVDSAGGHGWPGTRERRAGNTPIAAFSGAECTWRFFKGKSRQGRMSTQASVPRP